MPACGRMTPGWPARWRSASRRQAFSPRDRHGARARGLESIVRRPHNLACVPDPSGGAHGDIRLLIQLFINRISDAPSEEEFHDSLSDLASANGMPFFAYYAFPTAIRPRTRIILTYAAQWAAQYMREACARIDPVLGRAQASSDPFSWAAPSRAGSASSAAGGFFAEPAQHGIRAGYAVPIHDGQDPVASVTLTISRREWLIARTEQRERMMQAANGVSSATYELFAGIIEFGLSRRLSGIVAVTDARMERILRRANWPLQRIGAPRRIGPTMALAGLVEISRGALDNARRLGQLSGPVLWEPVSAAAA